MAGSGQGVVTGSVVAFEEGRGYGEVEAEDGRRFFFHCTAIADGSRAIAVGAEAVFRVVPGHRGRWEAASVVGSGPQAGEEPSPPEPPSPAAPGL